jgi:hypothetical protein
MEHIFRFRDFIFESQEEFTDEEYALKQNYERKTQKKEPRSPEEARAYRKWYNLKKANPAAIARFMKDNTPLTEEEYVLYLKHSEKNRKGLRQEMTRAELDVYNKYQRLKDRGIDPLVNIPKKELDYTPFTEAEYDLWLNYSNKNKGRVRQEITQEEQDAYNKYQRLIRSEIDPFVNIPKREIDYTPMTGQEKELLKNVWKKRNQGRRQEITQEELKAYNKHKRLKDLQDDDSLDPSRPFTPEETALYKIYLDKMKRGETPSKLETKAANRFDFLRRLSDEDLE